jgi:hypothetical protein
MYFSIVLKVGRRLRYFVVFLIVQVASFAHAFHILLRPKGPYPLDKQISNDDPNNPWNLVPNYYQISKDGTIMSTIVQVPDKSTNMFTSYWSALYAMYLFLIGMNILLLHLKHFINKQLTLTERFFLLIGDSGSFANWSISNLTLITLMILFTLLNVIYLLNLLIGIIGTMIEKDLKSSYLIQKAKVFMKYHGFVIFIMLQHIY